MRRRTGWVEFDDGACSGCGLCVAVCPMGCLELSPSITRPGYATARYRGSGCRADGMCYRACPEPSAITVHRSGAPQLVLA